MFNLKELSIMRQFIDKNANADNKEMMKIRQKITDIIILQHAWNIGVSIELEKNCE